MSQDKVGLESNNARTVRQPGPPANGAFRLIAMTAAASLVLILSALLVTDRVIIPALEERGLLDSHLWQKEDARLLTFMSWRNRADDDCAIWRSEGFPVEPKKTKAKRILVLGDSYVWGTGYKNMNTLWWRQLEKELIRRGYDDVEVIGAGKIGDSTRRELNRARKLAPEYRPDLIIFGFVTNDADERSRSSGERLHKHLNGEDIKDDFPTGLRTALETVFPNMSGQLFKVHDRHLWRKANGGPLGLAYEDWELKLLTGDNFKQFEETVRDLSAFMKTSGIPCFVLALPRGYQSDDVSHRLARKPLKEFLKEVRDYNHIRISPAELAFKRHGVPFHNTLDRFIQAAGEDPSIKRTNSPFRLGIIPANGQPGAMCTHFYAVEAANVLEHKYGEILGAKRPPGAQAEPRAVAINDWLPQIMALRKLSETTFALRFPDSVEHCLFMPIRRPHIQLNFQEPVFLSQIKLSGPSLSRASLYATFEDGKLNYDDGTMFPLGEKSGSSMVFPAAQFRSRGKINAIAISAQFKRENPDLLLEFKQ